MTYDEILALDRKKMKATSAARGREIVRKSSDQQMLDHLAKAARVAVDAYFANGRDCAEAMRELRSFVVLAERRAK